MDIRQILLLLFWMPAAALAGDPTPPDKYEVLSGEGLEGSGFVIRQGDKFFGVASVHQFDGKAPSTLEPLQGDPIRLDKTRVFRQRDVQVLPVLAPSPTLQFLNYSPDFSLRAGDEVIILGPAGDVVSATLTARGMTGGFYKSTDGPRELEARTSEPFIMAGGSGGPIIHKPSGAVVGVLVMADDATRARVIGFQTLCFGVPASKAAAASSADAAAEQLAKVFPSLYWYASDACLRETTRHGFGQFQKHEEFVKSNKAVLEKVRKLGNREGRQAPIRLRLFDPESPEEYWVVELTRESNVWRPKTGYKYLNGKPAFDLFEDEFLAGARIMGSMKPYLERALSAYSEGKDFRVMFAKSQALRAQETSIKPTAVQLVGRWRQANAALQAATDITFRRDGTFVGSITENGKVTCSFSGKWTLRDGILNYEYTSSSGGRIPTGTKDQDKVITLTKDRYTIINRVGLRETYVRIE